MATSVKPSNCNETYSSCRLEKASGSHLFEISGFSLSKWMDSDEHIESATFNVGGYDWAIECFPYGGSKCCSAGIAIYVTLKSDATNAKAVCKLTLLDKSGRPSASSTLHSSYPNTFSSQGDCWGSDCFIRRSELAEKFIKDDRLAIQCTLTVLKPPRTEEGGGC